MTRQASTNKPVTTLLDKIFEKFILSQDDDNNSNGGATISCFEKLPNEVKLRVKEELKK